MTIHDRPILIGLGCSSAAHPDEIIALVDACLGEAELRADQIVALASHARKRGSRALEQTGSHFAVPLFFFGDDVLSPDISSTCEAVAAVAGPLHLPKRKSRFATCAIALCAAGWTLERLAQASLPNTTSASSTLLTSRAGR